MPPLFSLPPSPFHGTCWNLQQESSLYLPCVLEAFPPSFTAISWGVSLPTFYIPHTPESGGDRVFARPPVSLTNQFSFQQNLLPFWNSFMPLPTSHPPYCNHLLSSKPLNHWGWSRQRLFPSLFPFSFSAIPLTPGLRSLTCWVMTSSSIPPHHPFKVPESLSSQETASPPKSVSKSHPARHLPSCSITPLPPLFDLVETSDPWTPSPSFISASLFLLALLLCLPSLHALLHPCKSSFENAIDSFASSLHWTCLLRPKPACPALWLPTFDCLRCSSWMWLERHRTGLCSPNALLIEHSTLPRNRALLPHFEDYCFTVSLH